MELVKLFNWKFTGYMELPRLRGEVWQGTTVKNLSYQVGNTGLEKSEVIGPSLDYRSSFFLAYHPRDSMCQILKDVIYVDCLMRVKKKVVSRGVTTKLEKFLPN